MAISAPSRRSASPSTSQPRRRAHCRLSASKSLSETVRGGKNSCANSTDTATITQPTNTIAARIMRPKARSDGVRKGRAPQVRERDVKQDVGDPVGAITDAEIQGSWSAETAATSDNEPGWKSSGTRLPWMTNVDKQWRPSTSCGYADRRRSAEGIMSMGLKGRHDGRGDGRTTPETHGSVGTRALSPEPSENAAKRQPGVATPASGDPRPPCHPGAGAASETTATSRGRTGLHGHGMT